MNLEDKGILSDPILKAIDAIIDNVDKPIFGGSIALNAVGLLNRPISDIDLFFNKGISLCRNGFLDVPNSDIALSDTVTDSTGSKIQRTGIILNGVHICCFKVDDDYLQCSPITFLGRTINIQNVNFAILAKMAYGNKSFEKHSKDLQVIEKKLDDIFF